jgi:DNA-binding SARP family transcriptional activator
LVSFLLDRPGNRASKSELLNALFDGRGDESSRSYLRQAVNRLREVLPSADLIHNEDDEVWLEPGEFSSDSQRLQSALAAAGELPGDQQLAGLLSALEIAARGPFLDGVGSEWAVIRRRELGDVVADAQVLAAETAFAIGDYPQANELAIAALTADPYRESAWQLRMRVFNALGRGDELVATFRGCEQALSTAGLEPSPGTKRLLEQLRR